MHRKPLAALAAALSLLALAGIAFAQGGSPSSIQSTSATFMATTVAGSKSDTCTGTDGTYTRTRARYTGTATSTDARLSGAIEVRANTVYNADTKLGVVDGSYRIKTAAGHTNGHFRAVDTDGSLAGFADGNAAKTEPHAKLLANLSASFDPATGFSAANLGSGNSTDTAVFVSGKCPEPKPKPKPHGHKGASGPSGPTGATGPKGKAGNHGKHGKHGKPKHKH
jgi:hypothetical protein